MIIQLFQSRSRNILRQAFWSSARTSRILCRIVFLFIVTVMTNCPCIFLMVTVMTNCPCIFLHGYSYDKLSLSFSHGYSYDKSSLYFSHVYSYDKLSLYFSWLQLWQIVLLYFSLLQLWQIVLVFFSWLQLWLIVLVCFLMVTVMTNCPCISHVYSYDTLSFYLSVSVLYTSPLFFFLQRHVSTSVK